MAQEIAGSTRECAKHGQYINSGRGCPVCDGVPRRPKYVGTGGVHDRLHNRSHGEPTEDDWEWV